MTRVLARVGWRTNGLSTVVLPLPRKPVRVTLNRADEKLVEMSNGCICSTQPPQARALLVSRPFLTRA
jgi:hypothetical protein